MENSKFMGNGDLFLYTNVYLNFEITNEQNI